MEADVGFLTGQGGVNLNVVMDMNMYTYRIELEILSSVIRYSTLLRNYECQNRSGTRYGMWRDQVWISEKTRMGC